MLKMLTSPPDTRPIPGNRRARTAPPRAGAARARRRHHAAIGCALIAPLLAAGCTSYHAAPLPEQDSLAAGVAALELPAAAWPGPAPRAHRFDPADGLDMWETAMLAVANYPLLRAERRKRGVAEAQLYAARLFPDPQLAVSLERPTGSEPGLVNGYGGALGYDLIALVTRSAGVSAADGARRQVSLDLLWQEWQTVEMARSAHVELLTLRRKIALLEDMLTLYDRRYQQSLNAMRSGDLTVDVAGTDLTALLDTATLLNQLRQTCNGRRNDLALLLGLSPDAALNLRATGAPAPRPAPQIEAALHAMTRRRPDLLALAAGYDSQEARVRKAVLSQFPNLGLGITRARDTGGIVSSGLAIDISLPLFSGNRGNIAVERATREQLRAEYEARIDQSRIDVARLAGVQALIQDQRALLALRVPELEAMVASARQAYGSGDIDALTFLNMQTTLVNKQLEQLDLEQQLWSTQLALDTLLGTVTMDDQQGTPRP